MLFTIREEKMQQHTNEGEGKEIITKEYKGRFFNDCAEVTCFIKAQKEKKENVTGVLIKLKICYQIFKNKFKFTLFPYVD